jgi:hypothetical protein
MLGIQSIGAVVDTLTHAADVFLHNVPQSSRIISLCQSTLQNNIILLGFD